MVRITIITSTTTIMVITNHKVLPVHRPSTFSLRWINSYIIAGSIRHDSKA